MSIAISSGAMSPKDFEEEVNEDIQKFDKFFQTIGSNDPLSPFEIAAIKTYMRWKDMGSPEQYDG